MINCRKIMLFHNNKIEMTFLLNNMIQFKEIQKHSNFRDRYLKDLLKKNEKLKNKKYKKL